MRQKGVVTKYDKKKGYGFILPYGENQSEIFFHYTEIIHKKGHFANANVGDIVSFSLGVDNKGRSIAKHVYRWKIKKIRKNFQKHNFDLRAVRGDNQFSIVDKENNKILVEKISLCEALNWLDEYNISARKVRSNGEHISTEQNKEDK